MGDANIRLPEEAKDRLAAVAAGRGMSLRAYLMQLAAQTFTPEELAERRARALQILRELNGFDPSSPEAIAGGVELNRRLRALQGPDGELAG